MPSPPQWRAEEFGADLREVVLDAQVEAIATLVAEVGLDYKTACYAFGVVIGVLGVVSADDRLLCIGPALLPNAKAARLHRDVTSASP
jgi:hypothetical protein